MAKKVNIPEYRIEDTPLSCTWIVVGPPGSGKCNRRGTEVIAYDGSVVKVEDVKIGDLLMGDDSTPRHVTKLFHGNDDMYKISPSDGTDPYYVTGGHTLCLRYVDQISSKEIPIQQIEVQDYLKQNQSFKDKLFAYRSEGIEFNEKRIETDPYDFGYIISISGDINHISENYKTNTREVRLKLLAGLIDSRGFHSNYFYGIYSKNSNLTKDIVFIVRSLGFWCQVKKVDDQYNKIIFGGNGIDQIPSMKRINIQFLSKQEGSLHYKFTVEHIGVEEYFGFELHGINHRFLLADFTVTHNCLAKGTPVMMFDRTIKNVEDVIIGDQLLGDDLTPRNVLTVCQGDDELYEVSQSQAMTYTVNEPHILTLAEGSTLIDVPLQKYLVFTELYRSHKGVTIDVNSDEKEPSKIYSDIQVKHVGRGRYHGFELDGNHRFLLGDGTVTHNTSFMENMAYYLKHRYPVARIFIGTEGGYRRMCQIFHPLFVSNYYDEEEEKNHVRRQRVCEIENGKSYPGNYAINIIDDASDDTKIYRTKIMKGLFKLGSQHWNQLFMLGSQYAIDMPPDIRKSVSYVAIFFEPEENERKKLYNNFGGLAGSYENFCDLMDQITGDYTCLIFKKRTQSKHMEDNISFYRTTQLKDWKFGCTEYKDWGNQRYNNQYKEEILM